MRDPRSALLALPAPLPAQAQVTRVDDRDATVDRLQFRLFRASAASTRASTSDVLLADLTQGTSRSPSRSTTSTASTFGGEWLFGIGDYLEAGVGVGFYQRTVPSVYARRHDDDGTEIAQDLKLRIVPLTATVRSCRSAAARRQPYVGAGIGVFNWRYSEVGEFVDFQNDVIFTDRFVADGRPSARSCSAASASRSATCGPSAARCAGRRPRARD